MRSVVEGHRTRLRSGAAPRYRELHSEIPRPLADALIACGLVSWRIWIDGETLFHAIETRDGKHAMVAAMAARDPVDPAWDALIATLVDDAPAATSDLELVWQLDTGAT